MTEKKTAEAEKFLSDNGYGKGTNFTVSTVAYLMESYAAQQSDLPMALKKAVIGSLLQDKENVDATYLIKGLRAYTRRELATEVERETKIGNEIVSNMILLALDLAKRGKVQPRQSKMPTDTESEKASRDFALRIFDDRTQKVRIADTMWGWQKCFEWLRNQIEKR